MAIEYRIPTSSSFQNMTGETHGDWDVLRFSHLSHGQPYFLCRCRGCGREKPVRGQTLRNGESTNCGCLTGKRNALAQRTHGKFGTPEHGAWASMIQRCTNKRSKGYEKYGARGIRPCHAMRETFAWFYSILGDRPSAGHSLDRWPNNDGGYWCGDCEECKANDWPRNVRWATGKQQQRNRAINRLVEYQGRELCVAEWSEITGLSHSLILMRLNNDWDAERIFNTPPIPPNERRWNRNN